MACTVSFAGAKPRRNRCSTAALVRETAMHQVPPLRHRLQRGAGVGALFRRTWFPDGHRPPFTRDSTVSPAAMRPVRGNLPWGRSSRNRASTRCGGARRPLAALSCRPRRRSAPRWRVLRLSPARAFRKMTAALRRLGFDAVFDTNFAATSPHGGGTSADRRRRRWSTRSRRPADVHHCSPGWITCRFYFPQFLRTSRCNRRRDFGAVAKATASGDRQKDEEIVVVSVMPCTPRVRGRSVPR